MADERNAMDTSDAGPGSGAGKVFSTAVLCAIPIDAVAVDKILMALSMSPASPKIQ